MRRITLFSLAVASVLLLAGCRNREETNHSSSERMISTQEVSSTSKQSSTKETTTVSTTSTTNTTSTSETEPTVDTRNLTADQMKQWVAAIWQKRANIDLLQDPKYKIVLEIQEDQLLYARVEAAHAQIDTLDLFRVNSEGDLEEAGYYQSKPDQDWIVVSKNYLDTSLVAPAPAEETSQQGASSDHEQAEMVRTIMQQNQGFNERVLAAIPDEEILAANAGNATNSQIAQTADNLLKKYPELQQP